MTMYGEENLNTNVEESTDEQQYKKLKKFNFGAFIFGGIWGLFNGVYKPSYFWLLFFALGVFPLKLPLLGTALLVLSIIFGVKGNEWTYNDKEWKDFDQFQSIQKKWNIAGLSALVLFVIYIFVCFIMGFAMIGSEIFKAKNNPTFLINETAVRGIVSDNKLKNTKSSEELTELFLNDLNSGEKNSSNGYKYTRYKYKKNSVLLNYGNRKFLLTFKKSMICTLKDKNCSITTYLYEGKKIIDKSITYYDNAGKTKNVNLMKK